MPVHDRDAIFSSAVDAALRSMQIRPLKTPARAPQANAHCERFIGTARRECLDWITPFNECHLRRTLKEWITHYNRQRPHAALGMGVPDAPTAAPPQPVTAWRRPIASSRAQFLRVCITSAGWIGLRREFLQRTAFPAISADGRFVAFRSATPRRRCCRE